MRFELGCFHDQVATPCGPQNFRHAPHLLPVRRLVRSRLPTVALTLAQLTTPAVHTAVRLSRAVLRRALHQVRPTHGEGGRGRTHRNAPESDAIRPRTYNVVGADSLLLHRPFAPRSYPNLLGSQERSTPRGGSFRKFSASREVTVQVSNRLAKPAALGTRGGRAYPSLAIDRSRRAARGQLVPQACAGIRGGADSAASGP